MAVRAYLTSILDNGTVSITYVVNDREKMEFTERLNGDSISAVQALARQRAASLASNAEAVEKLKASIGQEIDLSVPDDGGPSEELLALRAFGAARFNYHQTQKEFADGLATQGELDDALKAMQLLYKRDLYKDSL